ncbi:single-stranded DNA-binding protein [Nocardioides sp. TRM66260-LWL]|uniref:single-stranded DNA-binding protein n=1 Tax=Nocardioides sp. TRM66260-LWL TaxID=2874478 RepID=UPI001CC640F7|nr:single-stranded DNA-binding protein [Nocardioides sp. TRM66260-LWL]MBZ5733003.1 single-stranded DNA-binding protein [Nocardioides sp. TRM66260-LWL]
MSETVVTLQGWLGSDVTVRQAGEAQVATFRLASQPRRWSRRTETWVDGETQWYSVSAWRSLGEHAAASLRRGDPVVLHGRLSTRIWVNNAGEEVTSVEVEALLLGHDLARGTSVFTRATRAEAPAPSGDAEPSAAPSEQPAQAVA